MLARTSVFPTWCRRVYSRRNREMTSVSSVFKKKALATSKMHRTDALLVCKKKAEFRICNVSGFQTELVELRANNPALCVLVIPGNPGIVSFYKDFIEALYEMLEENVSVIAVGHISHTQKNWERGRLFTLEDQINHKKDFIHQELLSTRTPILLVGHSIGSYISLEIMKSFPDQVEYAIGLYPFIALNKDAFQQSIIQMITRSGILSTCVSSLAAFSGLIPSWLSKMIIKVTVGKNWSTTAVEAACSHMRKYHAVRNVCFMAMTEFKKLSSKVDLEFIQEKQDQIAFLFGTDDHWGPLLLLEMISRHAPAVSLSIEREGHKHAFVCTDAGSAWVARFVANLIKQRDHGPKWVIQSVLSIFIRLNQEGTI